MLTPRSEDTFFGERSYVMIWFSSPAGAFQIETSSIELQQEKTASQSSAAAQQPEQPARQPQSDGWPQRVPDATLAPCAQPAPADAGCSRRAGAATSGRPVSAQPAPADAKCCPGAPGPTGACPAAASSAGGACPAGASGSWRPMPCWRLRRPLTGMACR